MSNYSASHTASGTTALGMAARAAGSGFVETVGSVFAAMKRYHMYRKTVHELSELSDHTLADIGIHRSQIANVAGELTSDGARGLYFR